jgi:hypothetical protein
VITVAPEGLSFPVGRWTGHNGPPRFGAGGREGSKSGEQSRAAVGLRRWVQGERPLHARGPAARRQGVVQRQSADHWGLGGSLGAPLTWRWTGHNGPPRFGAGGAGKPQARRVVEGGDTPSSMGAGRAKSPASDEPAIRFDGAAKAQCRSRAKAGGDATGTRSGSPCQDGGVIYPTHLAVSAKPSTFGLSAVSTPEVMVGQNEHRVEAVQCP